MSNSNWRANLELVGIATVIAGLVFVGMELRQSQQIAQSAIYQERSRFAFDYFMQMSEKPAYQERTAARIRRFYDSGRFDASDLNVQEREMLERGSDEAITDWYVEAEVNLQLQQNFLYQYQQGLSDDESWESQKIRLSGVLGSSVARQLILVDGARYRRSFVDVATAMVAEREAANRE